MKRHHLELKMFHKEELNSRPFGETMIFKLFHSANVSNIDVSNWLLCEFCGCLWKDDKKISFLAKNCFECEGSIIEKDYEYFFEKIIYNSV